MLNGEMAGSSQIRYALDTLLSTIGVPYRILSSLQETEVTAPGRPVYLVLGPIQDPRMDRLAQETAVVVLPNPEPSAISTQLSALSTQNSELRTQNSRSPDPAQVDILRQATSGGYLVGITADLIGPSFDMLSRAEEYATADRDQHDRFLWAHSRGSTPGSAGRPLVSEYANLLLGCLKEACAGARIPTIRKEPWPLGKPMAGCLTHDVDVVRRGKLPRGVAVRDVKGTLSSLRQGKLRAAATRAGAIARTAIGGRDPYWTFDRILALEKRHDYRSTFYFMAGRHHPEDASYDLGSSAMTQLLRSLTELGCEIGLHGSYATYRDVESLRSQKTDLERRVGGTVMGHRNHLLRFRVPDSWNVQEAAGFSYDATLGFADREGFRGGHSLPFHPYDLASERVSDLLEIPLAIMDVSLLKYRKLREEKAEAAVRAVLEQVYGVGGLATLLWHNDTFYDPEYTGSGRLYEAALQWLAERDAYVATAGEIDRWWRARSAVRLSPLPEGRKGWRMESPREIAGLTLRISLPDPQSFLRVRGQAPLVLKREGQDYLLEFGRLPSGFATDLEYE